DAQVFSGLLGGGMSSRLFQTAREERGLCYSIYASAWGLKDSGMFVIHAATGHKLVAELARVVTGEIENCAAGGVTEPEVRRAKAQIRAGLLMALESSSSRAEQMARQLLCHDRVIDTEELIARVDATTVESMTKFANKLLSSVRPAVAVVGAGKRSQKLAEDARGAVAA
ncbi:MAG TPA: insulinase family protein, partial [Hyphomicrobiaceae bacterium]|nr:insulinase family protein [Hyphomicrobiaceae bacterium]